MFTVIVPEEVDGKTKPRLIAIFLTKEDAKKFVRGFEIVPSETEGTWWVKSPNVAASYPKKVGRWVFISQQKAEEFIRQVKVKEGGNGNGTQRTL